MQKIKDCQERDHKMDQKAQDAFFLSFLRALRVLRGKIRIAKKIPFYL